MTNYRQYEDRNGLLKFFVNSDLEFEVVMKGLDSLIGSAKWGPRAKELSDQFIKAFDGLVSHKLPKQLKEGEALPEPTCLYDEFMNALREENFYFKAHDQLAFRKIHDECIRFFKDVSDAYGLLIKDDRRDLLSKR